MDNKENMEAQVFGDSVTDIESEETAEEVVLCEKCGENTCAENEDYCSACLEAMRNTRIPLIAWMAGAASVIVGIVAAATVFFLAAPSILACSAELAAKDDRWSDAYYYYTQMEQTVNDFQSLIKWEEGKEEPVLRKLFGMGTGVKAKMFEAYAKAYDPMDAITKFIIGNHQSYDEVLSAEAELINNKRVKPYWDIFSGILYTQELMSYSEQYPEEENYDTLLAFYELIENQEGADRVYTAYMKYMLATIYDKPVDVCLKWLTECDKLAKESGRDYRWLYYREYAEVIADSGKTDAAIDMLDMLTEINRNDFDTYLLKNRILLEAGRIEEAENFVEEIKTEFYNYGEVYEMEVTLLRYKGDYERAKSVAENVTADNDTFPEIRRQIALIYLAEGNYKEAFNQVDTAYSNAYNYYAQLGADAPTQELALTYYVCAALLEKAGGYTDTEANGIGRAYEIFGEDFKPEGEIKAIINGEKPVKEILTEGDCDFV